MLQASAHQPHLGIMQAHCQCNTRCCAALLLCCHDATGGVERGMHGEVTGFLATHQHAYPCIGITAGGEIAVMCEAVEMLAVHSSTRQQAVISIDREC